MTDRIIIDENAAMADIQRINQAIPILEQARSALTQVKQEGEQTIGKTGTAIVHKSDQLIQRIDQLIASLQHTRSEIQKTVNQNKALDAELARRIGANM